MVKGGSLYELILQITGKHTKNKNLIKEVNYNEEGNDFH